RSTSAWTMGALPRCTRPPWTASAKGPTSACRTAAPGLTDRDSRLSHAADRLTDAALLDARTRGRRHITRLTGGRMTGPMPTPRADAESRWRETGFVAAGDFSLRSK